MTVTVSTFKGQRGNLEALAAATLKAMVCGPGFVLATETDLYVADIVADEVAGSTRLTLSSVAWDETGLLPALTAADFTFTGLTADDCAAVVIYKHTGSDATANLVAAITFPTETVTGSLPIDLPSGVIARVAEGSTSVTTVDLPDVGVPADSVGLFDPDTTVATWEAMASAGALDARFTDAGSAALGFLVDPPTDGAELVNNISAVTAASLSVGYAGQQRADAAADDAIIARGIADRAVTGPSTSRKFALCDTIAGHDDSGWTTDGPAEFVDGYWMEAEVTVTEDGLDATPADGDSYYREIFTQTHDGIGAWDNFEDAILSVWSEERGRWGHFLFHEHTIEGASDDAGGRVAYTGLFAFGNLPELVANVPTRIGVWVQYDTGTNGELSMWQTAEFGHFDEEWGGVRWRRTYQQTYSGVTSIDSGVTNPWAIGLGVDAGSLLVDEVIVREAGPTGTILASPSATDAYADGAGAFDDPQSNTWTPGPDAVTVAGEAAGGGGGAPAYSSITSVPAAIDAIDGLTPASDRLAYYTSGSAASLATFTAAGRALVDDATASDQRTTLGLGTAAVAASTDFLASSTTLPWSRRVEIPSYSKPSTVSGTWSLTYVAEFSAGRAASASTNDQSWTWADLPLSAGTWVMDVYFRGLASGGIATLAVAGSSSVTCDTYTASTTANSVTTTSSFTVGTAGYKDLVVTNTTKNASSSNYTLNINAIVLRRTGA